MSNKSRFVRWKQSNPEGYDELLRRRRERYASDVAARQKQLEHNAAWRAKRRASGPKQSPNYRAKILMFDGHPEECWGIGQTSEALNVSKQTIANLESMGTIPCNHLVDSSGRRWWPSSFVMWLRPFFAARFPAAGNGISAQEFHRRVWTGWAEAVSTRSVTVVTLVSEDGDQDCSR